MQSKSLSRDQLTFSRLFVSIYLLLVSKLSLRKGHSLYIACRGIKKCVYSVDHINYSKSEYRADQSTLKLCAVVTYSMVVTLYHFIHVIMILILSPVNSLP